MAADAELSASGPLGIIAGSGGLPRWVIESCRAAGREVFVLALEGATDHATVASVPHAWCRIGAAATALDLLRANAVGDLVLAINGQSLGLDMTPAQQLVNQAGNEVLLTVRRAGEAEPRTVTVKTLADERPARYRDWVESRRRLVHEPVRTTEVAAILGEHRLLNQVRRILAENPVAERRLLDLTGDLMRRESRRP